MRRRDALAAIAVLFCTLGTDNDDGTIALAVPNPHPPQPLPGDASALIGAINTERMRHGLDALSLDVRLAALARQHADDMARREYFGHDDPAGKTFIDRLRESRYPYRIAGENLALDQNVPAAHVALMKSPPHRENILDPRFTRLGVAAVAIGVREVLYVEEFATEIDETTPGG
jgi:uncharacterized protein YkwD